MKVALDRNVVFRPTAPTIQNPGFRNMSKSHKDEVLWMDQGPCGVQIFHRNTLAACVCCEHLFFMRLVTFGLVFSLGQFSVSVSKHSILYFSVFLSLVLFSLFMCACFLLIMFTCVFLSSLLSCVFSAFSLFNSLSCIVFVFQAKLFCLYFSVLEFC